MKCYVLIGIVPYEFCDPLQVYTEELVAEADLSKIENAKTKEEKKAVFSYMGFDFEFDYYEFYEIRDCILK